MTWIDSHCHLDDPCFDGLVPNIIARAKRAGVGHSIIASIGKSRWEKQRSIASQHPEVSNAFGIHPWYCHEHEADDLNTLKTYLPHAVAIGECGLDYSPRFENKEEQMWWFQAQLDVAVSVNKPVIIHAVKALADVTEALKKRPRLRGVIHGFSGSLQQAKILTEMGFFIGLGTRLLHQNPNRFQALASSLSLAHILLETDSPDGLGHDVANEPAKLWDVGEALANARGSDPSDILKTCSQHARELFQL